MKTFKSMVILVILAGILLSACQSNEISRIAST